MRSEAVHSPWDHYLQQGVFFVFMLLWTRCVNLILSVLLFLTGHWEKSTEHRAWMLSVPVHYITNQASSGTDTHRPQWTGPWWCGCLLPVVCVLHRDLSQCFLLDHTDIIEFFLWVSLKEEGSIWDISVSRLKWWQSIYAHCVSHLFLFRIIAMEPAAQGVSTFMTSVQRLESRKALGFRVSL